MKNKDFNYYIKKATNNICNIHNAFYLWKNLRNAKYNSIYERYPNFWGITMSSLQLKWMLWIPKLFEESKKSKEEVISIPFLLKFIPEGEDKKKIKKEIDNQKPVLKNLKKWRNKILAHQDKVVADNIKDFGKKYPIKVEQIEKLLSSITKILGMIEPAVFNIFSLIEEGSKRDSDDIMSKLSKDLGLFKRT